MKVRDVILNGIITLSNKSVSEVEFVTFDVSRYLNGGETLSSATITVTVKTGVDATPNNIKSGSAQLSGGVVKQLITGGVAGVTYKLSCVIVTNQRTLNAVECYLPVVT